MTIDLVWFLQHYPEYMMGGALFMALVLLAWSAAQFNERFVCWVRRKALPGRGSARRPSRRFER